MLTFKQMMKRYTRHTMTALLFCYTSFTFLLYGKNANQFCWKAHARTTLNNILGDIAGNTFMKGYFQKLSDKSEEQY